MSLQITIRTNTLSPRLARAARAVSDRRPILEAMGTQLVSLTKRAFNDSSLRAATWPPKKDGSPSRLKLTGALYQSIRIANLTNTSVTVASDRPYAAAHQLGSAKKGLPPRPFFPFLSGRIIPSAAAKVEATARRKLNSILKA